MNELARKVDDAIFRVEQTIVTLAAMVMTATVFLDVVFRSFATPESQLARKLLTPLGWIGVERNEANYQVLRDVVTPIILVVLAFLAGWAIYVASKRRKEEPRSLGVGLGVGVGSVVFCYAFVQFVVKVPSKWVCMTLLLTGCAGVIYDAVRRKDWGGAAIPAIFAAFGSWVCTKLPPDYIWSQELSLILLAWLAFIGASMATRADKHILVEAAAKALPAKLQPWARALGLLFTTLFCLYFCVLAYEHVFGPKGDIASGEIRPATGIPAWTIIFSVVVAFGLMTLRFGAKTVDAFRNPQVPERDLTH